ncbi:unnamed protein product [Phaeothamnion confervicola]
MAPGSLSRLPQPLAVDLGGDVPFEPNTRTGVLGNGITYYVRANPQPRERADLSCIIKVGSVQEGENERGLAHFIEHLSFRGTRDAPSEFELVKELESHGVAFGAHQNASTSFEETVYELHVPVDEDGVIEKALRILRQLALEVRLSDEDVRRERSIVVSEERQRRSSAQRCGEDYMQLLLRGSLYAERFPIGLMEVIEGADADTFRTFYDHHYHPQLAAVLAVGDFQQPVDEVVALVTSIFEAVPKRIESLPPRAPVTVPEHSEPRVGIFVDREASSTSAVVDVRVPKLKMRSVREYRQRLVEDLFHMALNSRLAKAALADDPDFLSASSTTKDIVGEVCTAQISVTCGEGGVMRALRAALFEVQRVKSHGLGPSELENAKKNLLSEVRSQWLERHQTESSELVSELLNHYTQGEPVPGIEWETGATLFLLQDVTLADVNAVVWAYDFSKGTTIHVTQPAPGALISVAQTVSRWLGGGGGSGDRKEGGGPKSMEVSEAALLELLRDLGAPGSGGSGSKGELEGANGEEEGQLRAEDLLPADLVPGSIVSHKHFEGTLAEKVDAHELVLSNGMRLTYRCSDFFEDEILWQGYAHGGLMELPQGDWPSARMSCVLGEEFGLFGIGPARLIDVLTGKRVSLAVGVDCHGRFFSGECAAGDLETFLTLVHALFTAEIKFDERRLEVVLGYLREYADKSSKDPQTVFGRAITAANTGDHPLFRATTRELLDKMDARKAVDYFSRMYKNPAEFQLVACGSIKAEEALPLFEKYMASIPRPPPDALPCRVLSRTEVTPLAAPFPAKQVSQVLRLPMVEETAATTVTFAVVLGGPAAPTHMLRLRDNVLFAFVGQVLERRLLEVLRFEAGAIYTVEVSESFSMAPPLKAESDPLTGTLSVSLTCRPGDAAEIRGHVVEEVRRLQAEGPTETEVKNAVQADRRDRETQMRTNSFWLGALALQYHSPRYNCDIAEAFDSTMLIRRELYRTMDPPMLQEGFQRFFGDCSRRTEVTLLPRARWRSAAKWGIVAAVGAVAVVSITSRLRAPRK